MSSIAYSPVRIQTSSQSVPALPSWFGEVTIIAHYLTYLGILEALCERVRFTRRRFGLLCSARDQPLCPIRALIATCYSGCLL
jgi:hypothetical protein